MTHTNGTKPGKISLHDPEMRSIAVRLADLARIRMRKEAPLNVRRREQVRRRLAEAGEALNWAVVSAVSDKPIVAARRQVTELLRRGARVREREVSRTLAEKEAEAKRIEAAVEEVRVLTDAKEEAFPVEISFPRTAKDAKKKYRTEVEEIRLEKPEDAKNALRRLERSMPRWNRLRRGMEDWLERRRDTLRSIQRTASAQARSWDGLLDEVLQVMV